MYNLSTLRATEFPQPSAEIYLNHAAISPLPARSQQTVTAVAGAIGANPSRYFAEQYQSLVADFQATAAALINAEHANEIVAVPTTATGINLLAQALPWQPGDNLLICETEFPANVYPWMSLERNGVDVRLVPAVGGGLTLEKLEPLVDERTRLVSASSVQFLSGHRSDLEAIGAFCHARGLLFVVDAIQAVGHFPHDVQGWHIDALVTGGQKSLMGTPGCGFMYLRTAVANICRPRFLSGSCTDNYLHWLDYDLTLRPAAGRFEQGTPNMIGIAAARSSMQLLQELGLSAIDCHTGNLARYAHRLLTENGFRVITPLDAIGPIVTWHSELSSADTDGLVAHLRARGVTVGKHLDRPGNAYVRASFHCYNTQDEVEQLVAELTAVRQEAGRETA